MARIIFDTETTGLNTPFCYDIGYVIINDHNEIEKQCHYIVEQVWHNLPLFESAYYKEKRVTYIKMMRARVATMNKFGYIMQDLARDIKNYNVTAAYAYNSSFDEKVINFNCDWYKCINPFDNIPIFDIWGYSSQFITNDNKYYAFCEKYSRFTESENYSGNAETVYQYLTDDETFVEAHMGLHDALIECEILLDCIDRGAQWETEYKVNTVLKRIVEKPFVIKVNGKEIYSGKYVKKYIRKDNYNFTTLEAD